MHRSPTRPRSPRPRPGPSARGFTLIELVVTVAIVSILTMLAVPSYQYVTTSSRLVTEINSLSGDLQFARIEAIKEGLPVTVCASSDGATCSLSPAWQGGWIVFSDTNANQVVDAGENLRRVQTPLIGGDSLVASPGATAVTFNRQGFAMAIARDTTFVVRDSGGSNARDTCLLLTRMGSTTSEHSGTGACP